MTQTTDTANDGATGASTSDAASGTERVSSATEASASASSTTDTANDGATGASTSDTARPATDAFIRSRPFSPEGVPLLVEPATSAARSPEALVDWLEGEKVTVREQLLEHGALLFRGFGVNEAGTFERVARAVDPDLKNEYLGTSPRDGLTDYVFTASELPSWYPIPQHCEMSFVKTPPRHVFFCALEPSPEGGETPLCDFRKVYRDLDPDVRRRFIEGGVRIVRNYAGPKTPRSKLDPWKLKRWDEMFETTDKDRVTERATQEGFEPEWLPNDVLRLVSTQLAVRRHPQTDEPAWYCHTQVFHIGSAAAEYRRIFAHRRDARSFGLWAFARALTGVKRRTTPAEDLALHCTYADGREMPDADLEHLRDVIWKHLVAYRWERGDVVAIDNASVSHGRLPYRGPRTIAVCWA